jgi:hypothetical protein
MIFQFTNIDTYPWGNRNETRKRSHEKEPQQDTYPISPIASIVAISFTIKVLHFYAEWQHWPRVASCNLTVGRRSKAEM